MTSKPENLLPTLGFLRIALLLLALVNVALPLADILFAFTAGSDRHDFWTVLIHVIAPAMAPLLVVVIFFDYIMSRVRAADAEGAVRTGFTRIGRVELAAIGLHPVVLDSVFLLQAELTGFIRRLASSKNQPPEILRIDFVAARPTVASRQAM